MKLYCSMIKLCLHNSAKIMGFFNVCYQWPIWAYIWFLFPHQFEQFSWTNFGVISFFSIWEGSERSIYLSDCILLWRQKFPLLSSFFVFVFLHSQKTTDLITSKTAEKRQKSKTYPTESSHFLSLSQYNLFSQIIFLANDVVVQSCF